MSAAAKELPMTIRPAGEADIAAILGLIRELAAFEKLTDACVADEALLRRAQGPGEAGDVVGALWAVERLDLDGYRYFHSTRGELLRRLGRREEARAALRRALELASSTPERRFLASRLDDL